MTLKELYQISYNEMRGVMPNNSEDFRLEEAILDPKTNTWSLVISYLAKNVNQPTGAPSILSPSITLPYERVYKKISVNDEGKFMGFAIYEKK